MSKTRELDGLGIVVTFLISFIFLMCLPKFLLVLSIVGFSLGVMRDKGGRV